jgi:hypothetical protein
MKPEMSHVFFTPLSIKKNIFYFFYISKLLLSILRKPIMKTYYENLLWKPIMKTYYIELKHLLQNLLDTLRFFIPYAHLILRLWIV